MTLISALSLSVSQHYLNIISVASQHNFSGISSSSQRLLDVFSASSQHFLNIFSASSKHHLCVSSVPTQHDWNHFNSILVASLPHLRQDIYHCFSFSLEIQTPVLFFKIKLHKQTSLKSFLLTSYFNGKMG